MRPVRVLAGLAASALLIAACSSSATSAPVASSAPSTPAASVAGVSGGGGSASAATIQNFSFQPASITVAVGSTVTWTNKDSASHTVTADDGSFDSKPIASGSTFSQTFTKAGTYAYHCAIHPSMKATITVQ